MENNNKIIKEINLSNCPKVDTLPRKLDDILNEIDLEILKNIYRIIIFSGKSFNIEKISKKELIKKLYKLLTDEKTINIFLSTLIKDEYEYLEKIVKKDGLLEDNYTLNNVYTYLVNAGITYTFNYKNNLYLVIPDEVLDIINKLDITKYKELVKTNDRVFKIADSSCNYYGVVQAETLFEYLKESNIDLEKSIESLHCILFPVRTSDFMFEPINGHMFIHKTDIIGDGVYDENMFRLIDKYSTNIDDIAFKEISLNKLLKYEDPGYYELTDNVMELRKFFKEIKLDDDDIEQFLSMVTRAYRETYYDGPYLIHVLIDELSISTKYIDKILDYVDRIVNELPLWGNFGYTNKDIIFGKVYYYPDGED